MEDLLINGVRNIQGMLSGAYKFETEQATKQGLILPLLQALGYNIFNIDEVTPEAVADVGIKKGEKVDYKVSVNGQAVMIIECKQRDVVLSDKYIEQLYRYYATSKVTLAVLTNGDDYWFFTDSDRENIMDTEPYNKIKISKLQTDSEISNALDKYCKANICDLNVKSDAKEKIFIKECNDIADGIINNTIPEYIINAISKKVGIDTYNDDLNKYKMADIFSRCMKEKFLKYSDTLAESSLEKDIFKKDNKEYKEVRGRKCDIKLNHEYTYDDYSDGDWRFHKLDYCLIDGVRYDNVSAFEAYTYVIDYALKKDMRLVNEFLKKGTRFKLKGLFTPRDRGESFRWGVSSSVNTDLLIYRGLDIGNVVKSISYVLDCANLSHDLVKFSFRE